MSRKKLVLIGTREVSKRGGSLSITIPTELVKYLDLEAGDKVMFLVDEETKDVFFKKYPSLLTAPSGLSFSVSKESVKKLLEEKEE